MCNHISEKCFTSSTISSIILLLILCVVFSVLGEYNLFIATNTVLTFRLMLYMSMIAVYTIFIRMAATRNIPGGSANPIIPPQQLVYAAPAVMIQ